MGSDTRIKIRGHLTLLGFEHIGGSGAHSETWTDGHGEAVTLVWDDETEVPV